MLLFLTSIQPLLHERSELAWGEVWAGIGLVGHGDSGWIIAGGAVCADGADENGDAVGLAGGGQYEKCADEEGEDGFHIYFSFWVFRAGR